MQEAQERESDLEMEEHAMNCPEGITERLQKEKRLELESRGSEETFLLGLYACGGSGRREDRVYPGLCGRAGCDGTGKQPYIYNCTDL